MKVLIVDDHALVREGLAQVLGILAADVEVHQAASVRSALACARALRVLDLALIDLALPDGDGLELVRACKGQFPGLMAVVLSGSEEAGIAQQALAAGAVGFIPKSAPTAVLLPALELVLAGGLYMPPDLTPAVAAARSTASGGRLTQRQQAILIGLSVGATNKHIAMELGISEATVKAHVSAIFRVFGVSNRTQAVRAAQDLGLV